MISLAFLTTLGQSGASGCRTINHWQLEARKPYGARLFGVFALVQIGFKFPLGEPRASARALARGSSGHHQPEGANQLCSLGISAKPPTWRIVKVLSCYGLSRADPCTTSSFGAARSSTGLVGRPLAATLQSMAGALPR